MNKLISEILHFIYPSRCVFCGEFIKDIPMRVCSECIKNLPYNKRYCNLCGRPVDTVFGDMVCADCKGRKSPFERVYVPLLYKDGVRKAIIDFKYRNKRSFARTFAIFVFAELKNNGYFPDAVTYVPIHFLRKMKRGYCQTEILAEEIASLYGVPVLPLAKKCKYTRKLATLSAAERRKTVKNSFKATDNKNIKDKNILLVDDIVTTSATITECGNVIKKAYGCRLSAATVAATDKNRKMF